MAAALPPVVGLGLDITKNAARHPTRLWPMLAFAVADLWTEWPVPDATIDLVISVFAPKNFPEAVRVLRPGGWLASAYPGPDHMIELIAGFGLIRSQPHKTRRYVEAAKRFIGPPAIARLRSKVVLDAAAIRTAVLMDPNARHIAPSTLDAELSPVAVTFDIYVLLARKAERNPSHPTA